jgi:hypothetical protein
MKSLIFTLALMFSFVSYSQKLEIDKETGLYTIQGVQNVSGVSKNEIFDKIYRFLILYHQDMEKLIIQPTGDVYSIYAIVTKPTDYLTGWLFKYKILVEIKDGKFRYTFTNFYWNQTPLEGKGIVGKKDLIEKTEFDINNLIIRLELQCKATEKW